MGRQVDDRYDADSVFVPVVHDPGGFLPIFCCRCGAGLVLGCAKYAEGPVCRACDYFVQMELTAIADRAAREGVQE